MPTGHLQEPFLAETLFAVLFTLPTMAEEEFSVVVADNGSGTCNTEFAGDDAPRVELHALVRQPTVILRVSWSREK